MRVLGGLLTLLASLLAPSIFAVAAWAMLILMHEGHTWVFVLWFFMVLPALALPFFTHLWLLAVLLWVAFFVVAGLASAVDDA